MSKQAHIVAVRGDTIGELGWGISTAAGDLTAVFCGEVWIGPRPVLEESFEFVQPIPYIVIRRGNEVLAYERGNGGGETRLFDKVSIGFGGHVDLGDAVVDENGVIDLRKTMENACVRELEEELGITFTGMMPEQRGRICNWTHVISSDASPVDEVHIGLVATIDIETLPAFALDAVEEVIKNARWVNPDGLFTDAAAGLLTLESWTSLVLSHPLNNAA